MAAGEDLLKRYDKLVKFWDRYQIFPCREGQRLHDEIAVLWNAIPVIEDPKDMDELLEAESKRRLATCWYTLEEYLNPQFQDTFERRVGKCGIPLEDINDLRTWLMGHREAAFEAIDRLFKTREIEHFQLTLKDVEDIPEMKRKAIALAEESVRTHHRELGQLVESLTEVGDYLQDISAVPTERGYSYFWSLTDTLALDIYAICYVDEGGELRLREEEIISLYGHEGMGHALNATITKTTDLPYILTFKSESTKPVAESVAMFYMKQIFRDLEASPETQQALGIASRFGEILLEVRDTELLTDYKNKLGMFSILVLGDKQFGPDPRDKETLERRTQVLDSVALEPTYARGTVIGNLDNYTSKGDFSPKAVDKLLYCTGSVDRALKIFEEHGILYSDPEGRSLIDKTFLTGYWTAQGFEDNARLVAEAHAKS